jgi:hypothetical protein
VVSAYGQLLTGMKQHAMQQREKFVARRQGMPFSAMRRMRTNV